jgi:hypothetical protein
MEVPVFQKALAGQEEVNQASWQTARSLPLKLKGKLLSPNSFRCKLCHHRIQPELTLGSLEFRASTISSNADSLTRLPNGGRILRFSYPHAMKRDPGRRMMT